MGEICKVTRTKKYSEDIPSEIYKVLYGITKKHETAQLLWGFSQENLHLSKLKLPTSRELTVEEFFKDSNYLYELLETQEQKADFINYIDKLSEEKYSSHTGAMQQAFYLRDKYPQFSVQILSNKDSYTVKVVPNTETAQQEFEKEQVLSDLNSKLISYIETLGFAVKEVDGLSTPGVFAPKDAIKNSEGMIEAIQVSKNRLGKKAIPEEVSHLLVAGMHKHPLMQRLRQVLTPEIVKELLEDQYQNYYNKYNGNLDKLQEEIIGKMVAQNMIDRNGLSENIQYISSKFLDKVQSNLQQGQESYIKELIEEAQDIIDNIVTNIETNESFLQDLDVEEILKSEELYNLDEEVSQLQKLADKSYELYAKKIKIQSFKNSNKVVDTEITSLKEMKKLFEKSKFFKGCVSFLKNVTEDCVSIYEDLRDLKDEVKQENDEKKKKYLIKKAMKQLSTLSTFINAYEDVVNDYQSLSEMEGINDELGEEEIDKLKKTASEVSETIKNAKKLYQNMRMYVLLDFYGTYWKNDIITNSGEQQSKLTLRSVLESQMGDTTGFDRLVNSIADSRDPLLRLTHTAFQDQKLKMNREAVNFEQALSQAEQRYFEKTGSRDTSFIYARKADGTLNGMYKSDRDYNAYYAAHRQHYEELKKAGKSPEAITRLMRQWRKQNTESVSIIGKITERVPKKSKYPSNDLQGLTEAQLQYYNDIINIKKQLRVMVPGQGSELYKAPQIKASAADTILQKKNPKGYLKRIKEQYITTDTSQDIGFGELLQGDKYVVLDFQNKEVKRVPVYYNKKLDDMSQLNTNTTDSMIAYANMAVNYKHMNELADVMDLTLSMMNDRDIKQTQGRKKMFYKYKVGDQTITGDYTIKGANSTLRKQLEYFIDANVYGRRKKLETITWQKGENTKEFNYGKLGDSVKQYSTLVGMGLNEFSSSSNIVMGLTQLFREAIGRKYFKVSDLAWAIGEYFKLRPKNAVNAYSNNPNDKLTLLLKKFDCLNDLNRDLNNTSYDKGLLRRVLGKFNLLIGNLLGEHFLRSVGMLATLKGKQVLYDKKTTSLYDVLKVEDTVTKIGVAKNSTEYIKYDIVIEEGATELNGNEISFLDSTETIQEVNRITQGGYADSDKGAIYEYVAGRAVMHYRQWMPALYSSRFGVDKINTRTGQIEKTDYRTAFTFLLGNIQDLLQLKFNIATRINELSVSEKASLRKVLFDMALILILSTFLPNEEAGDDEEEKYNFLGISKSLDGDDPWVINKIKLLGLRLLVENKALTPGFEMLKSNTKIIKDPIASMDTIDSILGIFDIASMSDEIESGRFEGWSRWAKNLYMNTPVRNIEKFINLMDGDTSMFKPYLE